MISPNPLAYAVLAFWPFVVWKLYQHLDAGRALIWTVVGAYLLLPPLTKFDLPVVPDFDKDTLPSAAAAVILWLILRQRDGIFPKSKIALALMGAVVAAPFFTVLTNADPIKIRLAPDVPGMRLYDSFAIVATQALYILPMFLARRDLANPKAMRDLLRILVIAGLIYSIPMLLESRLSPQLNRWIYGYFQHDFSQTIRFGGFRPVVFTPHGLWLAMFALLCLLAAAFFLREGPSEARPKQLATVIYLILILYICKSFGPAAFAMAGLPLILFASPRWQVLLAAAAGLVVITYPLLRGLHLVPIWEILDFVRGLNAERAWSLEYRLVNEEMLLEHAALRPFFGWGGYGRNFIHDLNTGRVLTVGDGYWIIRIGQYGWLGYLAEFGLLCLPLFALGREALSKSVQLSPVVGTLALMLAFNLTDLLPNATIVPLTWLMAGGLLGQAEILRRERLARAEALRLEQMHPKASRTLI